MTAPPPGRRSESAAGTGIARAMIGLRSRTVHLSNRIKRCLSVVNGRKQRRVKKRKALGSRASRTGTTDAEPLQSSENRKSTESCPDGASVRSETFPIVETVIAVNYLSDCSHFSTKINANVSTVHSRSLLEGQCLTDDGWYDVRILKVWRGKCLVFFENAEGDETAWLPPEKIR